MTENNRKENYDHISLSYFKFKSRWRRNGAIKVEWKGKRIKSKVRFGMEMKWLRGVKSGERLHVNVEGEH